MYLAHYPARKQLKKLFTHKNLLRTWILHKAAFLSGDEYSPFEHQCWHGEGYLHKQACQVIAIQLIDKIIR
jgi:hypothetical protein